MVAQLRGDFRPRDCVTERPRNLFSVEAGFFTGDDVYSYFMRRTALLALLLLAISARAQTLALQRGDVIAQSRPFNSLLVYPPPGDEAAIADSFGIPKSGAAALGLPKYFGTTGLAFVDQNRAIYTTADGVFEWRAGLGASTVNVSLRILYGGEILRTRGGDLLIAELFRVNGKPRIVRFTPAGNVLSVYEIAGAPLYTGMQYAGVAHMDLLADQCTLLWTPNTGTRYQVHTLDICTGSAKADFLNVTWQFESDIEQIGSIRALPNGDVLIATQKDVRRFDPAGKKVATYKTPEPAVPPLSAETLLALTPDASGVWIGRYNLIHRIDFASPSSPSATFMTNESTGLFALSVAGEWRAAQQPPPASKRRSVR